MTKLGIISTYQRLLYTSAVKKDFYKSSRSFASSPGSGAQEGQAGVGNEISKTTEGSSKENTTTAEEGRGGNETFTTMAQQNENFQTSNSHLIVTSTSISVVTSSKSSSSLPSFLTENPPEIS